MLTYTPPNTPPKEAPIGAPAEKVAKAFDFICPGGKVAPSIPRAAG